MGIVWRGTCHLSYKESIKCSIETYDVASSTPQSLLLLATHPKHIDKYYINKQQKISKYTRKCKSRHILYLRVLDFLLLGLIHKTNKQHQHQCKGDRGSGGDSFTYKDSGEIQSPIPLLLCQQQQFPILLYSVNCSTKNTPACLETPVYTMASCVAGGGATLETSSCQCVLEMYCTSASAFAKAEHSHRYLNFHPHGHPSLR